jgi:tetratricopeptide (TPR) repeat protein
LALDSTNADVYKNKGITLESLGNDEAALEAYQQAKALNPKDAELVHYMGIVLTNLNRLNEALEACNEAVALNNGFSEAYYSRGNVFTELGMHESAMRDYGTATELNPYFSKAYKKHGDALLNLNRDADALNSYQKASSLGLNTSQLYTNQAAVLTNLSRYDDALASAEKAIECNSKYSLAWTNRGVAFRHLNRIDEALESFTEALALSPEDPECQFNLGTILQHKGKLNGSLECYNKAISLRPDYQSAHWNKSILLLLRGEYLEGWSLYEWRSRGDDAHVKFPSFSQPSWRGEVDISGKQLLIHSEQGFGDTIQFSRYAQLVLDMGVEVILEVRKPLASLMQTLHPEVSIAVRGEPLPEFDVHCPVMSLPYAFKTTVETVPSSDRYLSADPAKVALWQEKLGETSAKRVGLVWSGSATHKNDHNRSMALSDLLPLLDTPCEWHSLQKEYREGDLAVLEGVPQLHQHQDDLIDFSDTAALIECLDLVITVDTSVAHLAGAMGKPVWILLPTRPDFRWMLDRTDTPWYPSAQLFRQSEAGDWPSLIRRLGECLRVLIEL